MKKLAIVALATVGAAPAFAAPNFTTLTSAVDVSTTISAILAVGALMVGVALVVMGVRKIIRMSSGGGA